jgi:hypothetical protein
MGDAQSIGREFLRMADRLREEAETYEAIAERLGVRRRGRPPKAGRTNGRRTNGAAKPVPSSAGDPGSPPIG